MTRSRLRTIWPVEESEKLDEPIDVLLEFGTVREECGEAEEDEADESVFVIETDGGSAG